MRILFIISSFLVYYFSSGTKTDDKIFQASEQKMESQFERDLSNIDNRTKYEYDESEVEDTESPGDQAGEDDNYEQDGNREYRPDDNDVTWDEDPNNYPLETPDTYENVDDEEVQSPTHYKYVPAGACAICGDGTFSFSKNRRGTCSHHGGVAEWLK